MGMEGGWGEAAFLEMIARRIERRERLETERGVDLRTIGLPDLADLKLGLAVLRRDLASRHPVAAAAE